MKIKIIKREKKNNGRRKRKRKVHRTAKAPRPGSGL